MGLEAATGCLVGRETDLSISGKKPPFIGWTGNSKSGGNRICLGFLLPQRRAALGLQVLGVVGRTPGSGMETVVPSWYLKYTHTKQTGNKALAFLQHLLFLLTRALCDGSPGPSGPPGAHFSASSLVNSVKSPLWEPLGGSPAAVIRGGGKGTPEQDGLKGPLLQEPESPKSDWSVLLGCACFFKPLGHPLNKKTERPK